MGVGEVDGTPVLLQREYVEADVRIVTGFVEPHFFAGFSGGPEGRLPGAGRHRDHPGGAPSRAASPTPAPPSSPAPATPCTTSCAPPPRWRRPTCRVDVAINRDRRVTAVFAGPLPDAHDAACAHVETSAVRGVGAPFDLVVSTNGGYPLDRNLYQAVKGMAAAERIVREGGIVVMAAACEDGVPAGGALRPAAGRGHDAGRTRRRRPVVPSSTAGRPRCSAGCSPGPRSSSTATGLEPGEIEDALLVPAPDLDGAVASALRRLGPGARVAVIPEGPLTVATVDPVP